MLLRHVKKALDTRRGRAGKKEKVVKEAPHAPDISHPLSAIKADAEKERADLKRRAEREKAVWDARPSLTGCVYTGFGRTLLATPVLDGSHVVVLGSAGYVALFSFKALVHAVHVVQSPVCACQAPSADSEAMVIGLASGEVVVVDVDVSTVDARCRVARSARMFTDSPVQVVTASPVTKMVAVAGSGAADIVVLQFSNLEVACRFRGPALAKDRDLKARDVSGEDESAATAAAAAAAAAGSGSGSGSGLGLGLGLQRARPPLVQTANLASLGAAAQFARTVLQRGRAVIAASTYEVTSLAFDLAGKCLYATLAGPEALVLPVETALRVAKASGKPWDSQPHVVFASFEASRFRLTSALVIRDFVFAGASDGTVRVFKAGVPGAADNHNQSHASPHHLPALPQAEPRPPDSSPPPPPATAAGVAAAAGSMRLAIRPGKAEIASPVVQIAHLEVGTQANQVLILVLSQDRTQTLFVVDLVLGSSRAVLAVDACLVSAPLGLSQKRTTCLLLGTDELAVFDLKAAVALQQKEITAEHGQSLERSQSRAAERERGRTVDRALDVSTERMRQRREQHARK